jgi:hypothetical protein
MEAKGSFKDRRGRGPRSVQCWNTGVTGPKLAHRCMGVRSPSFAYLSPCLLPLPDVDPIPPKRLPSVDQMDQTSWKMQTASLCVHTGLPAWAGTWTPLLHRGRVSRAAFSTKDRGLGGGLYLQDPGRCLLQVWAGLDGRGLAPGLSEGLPTVLYPDDTLPYPQLHSSCDSTPFIPKPGTPRDPKLGSGRACFVRPSGRYQPPGMWVYSWSEGRLSSLPALSVPWAGAPGIHLCA